MDIPHVSDQSKAANRKEDGNSLASEPKKLLESKNDLISSKVLQFIRIKLEECLDVVSHSTPASVINTKANARKTVVEPNLNRLKSPNTVFVSQEKSK